MSLIIPRLNTIIHVSDVSSSYPTIGTSFRQPGYEIVTSNNLIITDINYHDSKQEIPKRFRMSTAAEELALQLELEHNGEDPIKAKVFDDLFGRNGNNRHVVQLTETGLRLPRGREAGKYETDEKGRKYWPRIVLIGDEEVGEVLVPEGYDYLVVEWNEVFGIPKATEGFGVVDEYPDITPFQVYPTFFSFNPYAFKDGISGHYDMAVLRRSCWPRTAAERRLGVDTNFGRYRVFADEVGFRLVSGPVPEVEKKI